MVERFLNHLTCLTDDDDWTFSLADVSGSPTSFSSSTLASFFPLHQSTIGLRTYVHTNSTSGTAIHVSQTIMRASFCLGDRVSRCL